VPFFNEGSTVDIFFSTIVPIMDDISHISFEVICIDDGSRDDTLERLTNIVYIDDRFRVIELSRNFGKEAALTAGIHSASGDAVIPMDADLQDPPELIKTFIEEWEKGADVVLGLRTKRESDSFLKRKTAALFYRVHNMLSSIEIPENVGDFRLMDRIVIDALKSLPENQLFMKGLFAWVGFKAVTVEFSRPPRASGATKFSGWKLWNFALEGITSFSTAPLKVWTYIGSAGAVFTLSYATFILLRTLIRGVDVPGYASLLVVTLLLGSIQLISIGVLGEYISRIYQETKQRPRYLIRRHIGGTSKR
jgi:glycosyltransferase involved in cell wall biosynthesis